MGRKRPRPASALSRARNEAVLVALRVLVTRHPRAALDMAATAAVRAGRVGVRAVADHLKQIAPAAPAVSSPRLTPRQVRRFLKAIDRRERDARHKRIAGVEATPKSP
jgi:hypothetical protein